MDGFLMAPQSWRFQQGDSLCTALVPQTLLDFLNPGFSLLTWILWGLELQFRFLSRPREIRRVESTEGQHGRRNTFSRLFLEDFVIVVLGKETLRRRR